MRLISSTRYGLATRVVLVFAGIWWCAHTLRQLPEDLKEFRRTKRPEVRWAMIANWSLITLVLIGLVAFAPGVVMEFVRLFH